MAIDERQTVLRLTGAVVARDVIERPQYQPHAMAKHLVEDASNSNAGAGVSLPIDGTVSTPDVGAPATTMATEPAAAKDQAAGPPAPEAGRSSLQTALIIVSLASALFLAALDMTIVATAIPTITAEFSSPSGYTWIGGAYMLANAAAAPVWGKISDIWGRKPILLMAVGVFWVASLLSAVSVNMGMLIAMRAVQGVGGGGIINLVNICISDLFSIRKRGIYLGFMGMVWAVAGGVGPILGGVFTSQATWRWCFYVNLPISGCGMAILVFALKLHNPRTSIREGLAAVDWLGSLTVVGGTLMVLLGLQFGGVSFPWDSATVICLIIFGFVVIAIFVMIEMRVAQFPLIPMRLFRHGSTIAALGVCALHALVYISGTYYLPLYFQAVLGATPLLSGAYILPYTVSLALTSAMTGFFIRKSGMYVPPILFGMAFLAIGYGLFLDLGDTADWVKIIIFQIIAGLGTGPNFQAPLIALQTTVEGRDIASATALFGFTRQLSTSISIVIGGVVFQNSMQKQYPTLLSELGPQTAALLTGADAGASVGILSTLPGAEAIVARAAYWTSLRDMYIMYVAFAGLGLLVGLTVRPKKLSKEHEEHKTGLKSLVAARQAGENERRGGVADEEKAVREDEKGGGISSGPSSGADTKGP